MTAEPQPNFIETLLSPFTNFLRSWDYRPVTSWFEHFVTINWNSGDAEIEEHVLGEVGSYGLQLARILDAVDLLVSELDLSRLTPEQQRIVVRVEDLAASREAGRAGVPRPAGRARPVAGSGRDPPARRRRVVAVLYSAVLPAFFMRREVRRAAWFLWIRPLDAALSMRFCARRTASGASSAPFSSAVGRGLDAGLQLRAHALVAQPPPFVRAVPLDLALDVRHGACSAPENSR